MLASSGSQNYIASASRAKLSSKFNLYGQYGKNFKKSPLGQYSKLSGQKQHNKEIETQTFKEIESTGDLLVNPSELDIILRDNSP